MKAQTPLLRIPPCPRMIPVPVLPRAFDALASGASDVIDVSAAAHGSAPVVGTDDVVVAVEYGCGCALPSGRALVFAVATVVFVADNDPARYRVQIKRLPIPGSAPEPALRIPVTGVVFDAIASGVSVFSRRFPRPGAADVAAGDVVVFAYTPEDLSPDRELRRVVVEVEAVAGSGGEAKIWIRPEVLRPPATLRVAVPWSVYRSLGEGGVFAVFGPKDLPPGFDAAAGDDIVFTADTVSYKPEPPALTRHIRGADWFGAVDGVGVRLHLDPVAVPAAPDAAFGTGASGAADQVSIGSRVEGSPAVAVVTKLKSSRDGGVVMTVAGGPALSGFGLSDTVKIVVPGPGIASGAGCDLRLRRAKSSDYLSSLTR